MSGGKNDPFSSNKTKSNRIQRISSTAADPSHKLLSLPTLIGFLHIWATAGSLPLPQLISAAVAGWALRGNIMDLVERERGFGQRAMTTPIHE
jgi:hypothetical protein